MIYCKKYIKFSDSFECTHNSCMISCGFINGDLRKQEKGYRKLSGVWKSVKSVLKLGCILKNNVKLLNSMKK